MLSYITKSTCPAIKFPNMAGHHDDCLDHCSIYTLLCMDIRSDFQLLSLMLPFMHGTLVRISSAFLSQPLELCNHSPLFCFVTDPAAAENGLQKSEGMKKLLNAITFILMKIQSELPRSQWPHPIRSHPHTRTSEKDFTLLGSFAVPCHSCISLPHMLL